jgi:hypothetical protein
MCALTCVNLLVFSPDADTALLSQIPIALAEMWLNAILTAMPRAYQIPHCHPA